MVENPISMLEQRLKALEKEDDEEAERAKTANEQLQRSKTRRDQLKPELDELRKLQGDIITGVGESDRARAPADATLTEANSLLSQLRSEHGSAFTDALAAFAGAASEAREPLKAAEKHLKACEQAVEGEKKRVAKAEKDVTEKKAELDTARAAFRTHPKVIQDAMAEVGKRQSQLKDVDATKLHQLAARAYFLDKAVEALQHQNTVEARMGLVAKVMACWDELHRANSTLQENREALEKATRALTDAQAALKEATGQHDGQIQLLISQAPKAKAVGSGPTAD